MPFIFKVRLLNYAARRAARGAPSLHSDVQPVERKCEVKCQRRQGGCGRGVPSGRRSLDGPPHEHFGIENAREWVSGYLVFV